MAERLRIGLVDLDTSHPAKWVSIIRELGHEVTAVWDGGTVYPEGYAREFATEHGVENTPDRLEEMAEVVDAAIIHSCNWDLHVERAAPFAERSRGLLIDKPMVGNPRDAGRLLEWAKQGIKIHGGSSLRFAPEAQQLLEELRDGPAPDTVMVGCGTDEFNYGIHAYALAWAVLGAGAQKVRWLGRSPAQQQVQITWADGRRALVSVPGEGPPLPYWATVLTPRSVHHLSPDSGRLYRALLEPALAYLSGQRRSALTPRQLMEPELAAIAANFSRSQNGGEVELDELGPEVEGYDGAAFGEKYRRKKMNSRRG